MGVKKMKVWKMLILIMVLLVVFGESVFAGDCDGLNLLMHFDEDSSIGENDTHVFDWSGMGNNGTAQGNPVMNLTGGKYNGAFEFDGLGANHDSIQGNGSGIGTIGTGNYTVSAWVYKKGTGDKGVITFDTYDPSWAIDGDGHIYIYDSGYKVDSIGTIELNKWQHVVFVREGTGANELKYYINGVADSSVAHADSISAVITFAIGSDRTGNLNHLYYWNGSIDEVAIWDRSLSATEILDLYNSGIPIFCADISPPFCSLPSPTGTLALGTTQTYINLTTDETANCRYSLTAGTDYVSMPNTFANTDSTSHSELKTGLVDGQTYNFYVRCNDTSGNYNVDDFLISFSVESSSSTCGAADNNPVDGIVSIIELMNYIGEWKAGSVTITELMTGIGEWKNGC